MNVLQTFTDAYKLGKKFIHIDIQFSLNAFGHSHLQQIQIMNFVRPSGHLHFFFHLAANTKCGKKVILFFDNSAHPKQKRQFVCLFVCLLSIFVSHSQLAWSLSLAHCHCLYFNIECKTTTTKSAWMFWVSIEFWFIYICVIVTDVPMTIRKKEGNLLSREYTGEKNTVVWH